MDDETRDKVREEVERSLKSRGWGVIRRSHISGAILAALDAWEEREPEPDPPPDSGGEVELPWESTPDEQADHVRVDEGFGGGADGTYVEVCAGAGAANVTPSEIPHMARALFQAAGLEWPGDEDAERLKREANQLQVQLAGCAVAAEGGTSPEHVAERGDYGWSASYQAVLDCRRELDQLRDRLSEAATALGCDLYEVPDRVREAKACEKEFLSLAQDRYHRLVALKNERDEARAEVERLKEAAVESESVQEAVSVIEQLKERDLEHADAMVLLEKERDSWRRVCGTLQRELRQARKLAPEPVALLRAAKQCEVPGYDRCFRALFAAAHHWQCANCPDLPEGGDDDR